MRNLSVVAEQRKGVAATASYADWNKAISAYLPSAIYPQSPQIFGASATHKQKIFS